MAGENVSAGERARRARTLLVEIARRRQQPGSGSSLATLRERSARVRWPDLSPILDPLPWAVVGAVATRLYMPERVTQDLDIVVLAQDVLEARRRLREAGYSYRGELAPGGSSWVSPDDTRIDLLEGSEPWWTQALAEAASNRDPQSLPVLPLPYLVVMKLNAGPSTPLRTGRVQDIADVARMLGQASEEALARVQTLLVEHSPELLEDVESLIALGRLEMDGGGPREGPP